MAVGDGVEVSVPATARTVRVIAERSGTTQRRATLAAAHASRKEFHALHVGGGGSDHGDPTAVGERVGEVVGAIARAAVGDRQRVGDRVLPFPVSVGPDVIALSTVITGNGAQPSSSSTRSPVVSGRLRRS